MKNIHQRICFDIVLLLSIFIAPFPVTLFFVVLGLLYYPRYGEAVGAALMIELLYRGEGSDILGSHLSLAAWALIALLCIEMLRTIIRERTR